MAFSPSIRIEEQAVGANENTWGLVLNTGFELIDAAIAGAVTVALPDANSSLTVADGAPDQARNAVLIFTGTLSAGRDVVIPAVSKIYIVRNQATQAVTVRVSGQPGVAVASGQTTLLWCDGTTTRSAITALPALVVAGALTAGSLDTPSLLVGGSPVWQPGDLKATARGGPEPAGWLWADGRAVSRATYAALFGAIGTTYGAGDGSTTFNLPDYRGRTMVALDNMGGTPAGRIAAATALGWAGGSETVTLVTGQIPVHTHTASTASSGAHTHSVDIPEGGSHIHTGTAQVNGAHSHSVAAAGVNVAGGGLGALGPGSTPSSVGTSVEGAHDHILSINAATHSHTGTALSAGAHTHPVTVENAGGGGAHGNVQPSIGCNVLIKT